jgi:hypothetical protein
MKILPSTLVAAGLAGTMLIGIAAVAQPGRPSPTFELWACNKSQFPEIHFAYVTISGDKLQAKGWSKLPQSKCEKFADAVKIGSFQRPAFWWHATTGDAYWENKTAKQVQICVNLNDHFEYTWDGKNRECGTGETPLVFYEMRVPDNERAFPVVLQ